MHHGLNPFAMEEKEIHKKKITKAKKQYQELLLAQQNDKHFRKKSIQATSSG